MPKLAPICGSAGNITSIASGLRAMIDATIATNSGNPIGRWVAETHALAFVSVKGISIGLLAAKLGLRVALHNPYSGIAAQPENADRPDTCR